MTDFISFPKIARYSREVVVSEKIDGTNASIYIGLDGEFLTGSRTRWITPDDDNFGFSRWAHANKEDLLTLGPGRHFGEWWGSGIQRNYGLSGGERRFSVFNVNRYILHEGFRTSNTQILLPPCVALVPVLWVGNFEDLNINSVLSNLAQYGSRAVPGFMKPEGIIIYHTASNTMFKKTLEKDDSPKSIANWKKK